MEPGSEASQIAPRTSRPASQQAATGASSATLVSAAVATAMTAYPEYAPLIVFGGAVAGAAFSAVGTIARQRLHADEQTLQGGQPLGGFAENMRHVLARVGAILG